MVYAKKTIISQSEQCFIESLLALMQKKDYQEITIKELARHADYDRKTFYRHFKSKEDVLNLYCSQILDEMARMQKEMGTLTFQSGILSYFAFWEKHIDFLYLLEKHKLLHFLEDHQLDLIYEHVGRKVQEEIPESLEKASDFSRYSAYFTYGGLWNVLVCWIKEKPRKTPEVLTSHILEFLRQAGIYTASS